MKNSTIQLLHFYYKTITKLLQNYCKDITNKLNSVKLLCKTKNICLNIGISCKSKKTKESSKCKEKCKNIRKISVTYLYLQKQEN